MPMPFQGHSLHLITTGIQELDQVQRIVRGLPQGTVDVLHIREKHRTARELVHWFRTLKPLLPQTAVLINDRLDAALAAEADGVQLGEGSLPPQTAKALLPSRMLIGRSVHSPDGAFEAARQGADFAVFGHVFSTGSKADLPPRGLDQLKLAASGSPIPVIAIGGMTPERAGEALEAGAKGVAVLSGVFLHPCPAQQITAYRNVLDRYEDAIKE